jgi:hypothetical protein
VGRIIEFPIRPEREWGKAEGAIRYWLGSEGLSEKEVDEICIPLKSHFIELSRLMEFHYRLEFPKGLSSEQEQEMQASIADQTERLKTHLHALVGEVLLTIGRLEIQLYEANHRKD